MDAAGAAAGRDPPVFPATLPFRSLPPPPAPLTPLYSSSSRASSSSAAAASHSHHHASSLTTTIASFPILLLTVLGILTTSALLLTYYVFVIRCCLTWHASSSHDDGSLVISVSRRRGRRRSRGAGDDHELPVVHGVPRGGGLDEPAIQALAPAFTYGKKSVVVTKNDTAVVDVEYSGECAVCLGEFQEEERVRLLPSCLHVFHVDCIDTWLHGNANCPLCRAAAITNTTSTHRPLIDHQLQTPEEEIVVIQVAGAEEEGITAAAAAAGSECDTADCR